MRDAACQLYVIADPHSVYVAEEVIDRGLQARPLWEFRGSPLGDAVLVILGDLDEGYKDIARFLRHASGHVPLYDWPFAHVIYVPGNHEFSGRGFEAHLCGQGGMEPLQDIPPNVHILNNRTVELYGRRFVGSTLWQPLCPENPSSRLDWPRRRRAAAFVDKTVRPGDIVLTHYPPILEPTFRTIGKNGDDLDVERRYVWCDLAEMIAERRPELWLFGHTHWPSSDFVDWSDGSGGTPVGNPGSRSAIHHVLERKN